MKLERSDIEFPVWRKKVDATLFKNAATPIPNWLCKVWNIDNLFSHCNSNANPDSVVSIYINDKEFTGRVINSRPKVKYRLFYEKQLSDILKDVFLMSYMSKHSVNPVF